MSLITKYLAENTFYFSTPKYELLVKKVCEEITYSHAIEIPGIIKKLKNCGYLKGKMLVGVLPFNTKESGCLYLTDDFQKKELCFEKRGRVAGNSESNNPIIAKKYIPLPKDYEQMVEKGINYISSGVLKKIVLSRGVLLEFKAALDVRQILYRLYINNSSGYTYALKNGKNKYLIGASPEMLISKRGDIVYSNPLAGSRPRGSNKEEDIRLAEELSTSVKDLYEHKIVVDNIVKKLTNICKSVYAANKPDVIATKQLWHLSSVITGEVAESTDTVLDIALAVHPTPAVCGVPQKEAYAKILELEGESRENFTGIIGWCDEFGNGDWAIAIRGAVIEENKIKIQAGAGIVKNSVPKEERKETGTKMTTVLNSINIKEI